MKKKMPSWFALVIIPFGGLLVLALVFASYYGAFLLTRLVLREDTTMNMGALRASFAVFLALIYVLFFILVKGRDLLKATLLSGPTVMLIVTLIYQNLDSNLRMTLILLLIPLAIDVVVRVLKKPWFYNYALLFSMVMAYWYGWPRLAG